ncbi:ribokinase [Microlunatus panaciterrae]|uniref:Ribokinase n=1 Tax=Microlunatus panaciterrae TaxID=400768 RepID=A0ABS2RGC5_9ACTN|nr:ribokinase [Microlunatus panaciterrae]MBM7798054.1 ribokinase [Microlunatus panaciterrae]
MNLTADPAAARPGAVVVVGSLNIDLTVRTERFPQPGETLTGSELFTTPGGKSSNQAVAASLLGSQVRLAGAVGNDRNGAFLLQAAVEAGVDVSAVRQLDDHATGSAMIVVASGGENTIIVSPGANGALVPAMVDPAALDGAAVLCLSLEVPLATVQAFAQAAHDRGALVLLNLSPYREVPARLLELADVLLVNRAEAALVLGTDLQDPDWAEVLQRFGRRGVHRAVVTLGAEGAVVLDGTGPDNLVTSIEPVPVTAVDTTGCGDAFMGAIAHRLAAGATLVDAAHFAGRASALAATAPGAQSSYATFAQLR